MSLKRVFSGLRRLSPLLGIFLFSVSLYFLARELSKYSIEEILSKIGSIAPSKVAIAALLTVVAYINLSLYDFLSARMTGAKLSYSRLLMTSFIGYSLSKNIGFTFLSGTSVRLRLYGNWQVGTGRILVMIMLNYLTFWLGFAALGGLVFSTRAGFFTETLRLQPDSLQILGVSLLSIYLVYFLVVTLRKKPFHLSNLRIPIPGKIFTLAQTFVSILDWMLSAAVLYTLMFPAIGYREVLTVFLISQFAGLSSQIPGGLGIFEAITLMTLSPAIPGDDLIAILFVYRLIFYLIPLAVAVVLLSVEELRRRRRDNT